MSKLGGFFARKSGLYDKQDEPATVTPIQGVTALPDNPLEIDEELFNALSTQMGGENEQLRNLMLDASAKIGELDAIKAAVDKLVDPVSKTLRAIEAEKAEKMSLQTVLNTTRTAYGKLRNEVGEIEKKAAAADKECQTLRLELASTQAMLRTAEATKAEIATDVAARRAQIADLEARLAHETGETRILREENKRLDDRLSASEKRVISIESDLNAARQRLMMAEDEKQAQQAAFEKASAEAAKLSRKLAETEAGLAAAQAGAILNDIGQQGWILELGAAILPVISDALALDGDDHLFNASQIITADKQLELTNGASWSVRREGTHYLSDWDWELHMEVWGCAESGDGPSGGQPPN